MISIRIQPINVFAVHGLARIQRIQTDWLKQLKRPTAV